MLTPRVFETPESHGEGAEQDVPRRPRLEPYHRPSQREMVRLSLERESHPDVYPARRTR